MTTTRTAPTAPATSTTTDPVTPPSGTAFSHYRDQFAQMKDGLWPEDMPSGGDIVGNPRGYSRQHY
jgi:hypothetical protein